MAEQFCPTCFGGLGHDSCVCGPHALHLAIPEGARPFIVHVTPSGVAPGTRPWELLDDSVCDGARIHPARVPSAERLAGRRHRGGSVWLAQATWSDVPQADAARTSSDADLWIYRLLSRSSALLLDLPSDSDRSCALYSRCGLGTPAAFGAVLDNLLAFADLWRLPLASIAVVGGSSQSKVDDLARIATICRSVQRFDTHRQAVRWLVSQRTTQGDERPWLRARATDSPPGPRGPQGAGADLLNVAVTDVGGHVGWGWLADLDAARHAPPPPPAANAAVRLLKRWVTSAETLWLGQSQRHLQFSHGSSTPASIRGNWKDGSKALKRFHLFYGQPSRIQEAPCVVGVGPLTVLGSQHLAGVLQLAAATAVAPRILIRDETTSPQLLKWLQGEFSYARTFTVPRDKPDRVLRYLLENDR